MNLGMRVLCSEGSDPSCQTSPVFAAYVSKLICFCLSCPLNNAVSCKNACRQPQCMQGLVGCIACVLLNTCLHLTADNRPYENRCSSREFELCYVCANCPHMTSEFLFASCRRHPTSMVIYVSYVILDQSRVQCRRGEATKTEKGATGHGLNAEQHNQRHSKKLACSSEPWKALSI